MAHSINRPRTRARFLFDRSLLKLINATFPVDGSRIALADSRCRDPANHYALANNLP